MLGTGGTEEAEKAATAAAIADAATSFTPL